MKERLACPPLRRVWIYSLRTSGENVNVGCGGGRSGFLRFCKLLGCRNASERSGSYATELVKKAREAMLTAVQIHNNPQIDFKSELFIVTTIIAWTYLLHAHYRKTVSNTVKSILPLRASEADICVQSTAPRVTGASRSVLKATSARLIKP